MTSGKVRGVEFSLWWLIGLYGLVGMVCFVVMVVIMVCGDGRDGRLFDGGGGVIVCLW